MSASEKLKALRLQPVVYADGDFKFRDGFSEESLRPLLDALPQIVAVVEAAEDELRRDAKFPGEDKLRAALSALEEVLKADDLGAADHPALPLDTAAPRNTPINRGTS